MRPIESGPAYRFGPLVVQGNQRYDADSIRRIARVPIGSDYDQQQLLDAQQRLASSGFFESVFLTLDTRDTDPLLAPVIAQLREAPFQRVVVGVGFTTDSGPRFSLDHTHNSVPLLDWRAVSKLSLDKDKQSLSTELSAIPGDNGWRSFTSAELKSEVSGSYTVDSGRLRGGRNQSSDRIDRSYFLQYDYAVNHGFDPPPTASALSSELGLDRSLLRQRGRADPWLRDFAGAWRGVHAERENATLSRALTRAGSASCPPAACITPTARNRAMPASSCAPRLGPWSRKTARRSPTTLGFLTGGDTTVRGYGFRSIGAVTPIGQVIAGRYLGVGSIE